MSLTIITSIFNGGDMVQPFLDNIAEQSIYDSCTHYLVCCNEVQGDDEDTCKKWASEHPNIEYHYLSPDPGIYTVWNMVCKKSTTPYLTNANIDDRLFPGCLEKHVALLDAEPEIDVAYCKNVCTTVRNDDIHAEKRWSRYPTHPFSPGKMLRGNLPHNHPVWRRSLHDRFGYFDDTIYSAADWEFWLRCVVGGSQFKLIPEVLGLYYWNPNGISTRMGESHKQKITAEARVRREYQGKIGELLRKSKQRQNKSQKV